MPFSLVTEAVLKEKDAMIRHFEESGSYSFPPCDEYRSANLVRERKGLMFAILIALTKEDERVVLRGFSGLAEGHHQVPGYVNPTYSINAFKVLEKESDEKVKDPLIDDEERRRRSKLYAERFADLHLFTDIDGNTFTLKDVQGTRMSTGSGDCAGIKVLNHAMRKGYKILGFTEFYYGPDTKERKKGLCYEPCETRCRKIIKRMLGLDFVYVDEDIAVINKDSGLLSAPGKGIEKLDSASERLKKIFPDLPVSPFVHRLDMDTSGIMVLAMNREAHRTLSMDFERRNIHKEYEALLEGRVEEEEGIIDAPMRLDVDNRPYQIIDYENGKRAITRFKVLSYQWKDKILTTRVLFSPETGRTHQLRLHSAFIGHPILSDRLYGHYIENERLMLHALRITITHPRTKKEMIFSEPAPF